MLTIFSFLVSSLFHPFFVSVIDIKHNAKDKTIEISTKVFVDDLEAALKKNYNTTFDLSTSTLKPENNAIVAKYLQSKLQLTVNGKKQTLKYIGYEIQKESVWIYAEVEDVASLKKLTINCNLLYDYQEKQSNIFNIKANGSEKNHKLDYPKSSVDFVW
ncbi:MAG: DUF6702 family protein [Chitinophagaceae bacterium]